MSVVQFGTIPLVAVASFLVGKLWHHSELVLVGRQRAYAEFLRKCVVATELLVVLEAPQMAKLLAELREAGAEVTLYGSKRVNKAVGAYLGKLGFLVGAYGVPVSELKAEMSNASRLYEEMSSAMRREALGWSVFALSEWVRDRTQTAAIN